MMPELFEAMINGDSNRFNCVKELKAVVKVVVVVITEENETVSCWQFLL